MKGKPFAFSCNPAPASSAILVLTRDESSGSGGIPSPGTAVFPCEVGPGDDTVERPPTDRSDGGFCGKPRHLHHPS